MPEQKVHFRIGLRALARLIAPISLGWQIYDSAERQRDYVCVKSSRFGSRSDATLKDEFHRIGQSPSETISGIIL